MSGGIRVLAVDDDAGFVEATATALEGERDRFAVETETDPAAAREHLTGGRPGVDCVVSDYEMPGLDGLALLRAVREDHPELPFVLFTGKGSEDIASEAISAGVTDYVEQRLGHEQFELLANRVENAVEGARARRDYRELFERAADGVAVVDPDDGTVVDANDRFCALLGDDRAAVVGDHLEAVLGLSAGWEPDAADGTGGVVEWDVEAADGGTVPLEARVERAPLGGRERAVVAVRDVSERVANERALARRADALATSMDGMAILDADGRYRYVNESHAAVYGYDDPAAMEGESWRVCYREEELERFETEVLPALEADGAWRGEATGWRADGTSFPQELSLTRLDDGGVVCVVRDVTERVERERTLRDRQAALQDAYEAITDRARSMDEQVRAVLAAVREAVGTQSAAFSRVHGGEYEFEAVAAAEGVNGPAAGTVEPLSSFPACRRVVETGESLALADVPATAPELADGGVGCYLGAPVRVDGEVYGTFRLSGDQPREEPFSDWAVAFVELLARWVGAALTRRRTRRRLRRQNDQLETFVGVVSHDLRNPLTVLAGSLELARETGDPDQFRRARAAVDRMEALIDGLLALARAGEQVDDAEPVELGSLAERCWVTVPTGEASLTVAADRTVRADPDRLRQLFENLFRNAVEHGSTSPRSEARGDAVERGSTSSRTESDDAVEHGSTSPRSEARGDAVEHGSTDEPAPATGPAGPGTDGTGGGGAGADGVDGTAGAVPGEGGGDVEVTVGATEDGFYVADDGPGIPEEERGSVFDSGYSTADDGTGLGLAIVERVAAAHGWTVSVTESAAGGARFEFHLD